MSVAGIDDTARRLSALGDAVRRAAENAVAEEAEALAAEGALAIEPGASPLERHLVAQRVLEYGTRRRPARPSLLRVLTTGLGALSQRLSRAVSGVVK